MKIALAQTNPTVGDFDGNVSLMLEAAGLARSEGADLVVFPELPITGYPPRDLLGAAGFVRRSEQALDDFAQRLEGVAAAVGYVAGGRGLGPDMSYNACALVHAGSVEHVYHKRLLPQYDVFDEVRYFQPGDGPMVFNFGGLRLGFSICEDIWFGHEGVKGLYRTDPIEAYHGQIDIMLNLSASPFVAGKPAARLKLVRELAGRLDAAVVYVNQVGGNDELIFDGRSVVVDRRGRVVAHGNAFETDLVVVDTERLQDEDVTDVGDDVLQDEIADITAALVLGTRDYVHKCGFRDVVIGLSGGIDSSVVAALAVEALGPRHVSGIIMPSRYSSDHSVADAEELALNLGIEVHHVAIEPAFSAYLEMLAPVFGDREMDITEENLQARIRGALLMAKSNKFGSLVLTTGNKSELSVGYATLYGDMCGAVAVISDVVKTKVYEVGRQLCRMGRVIPENVFVKPPSAELRPDQVDQDSLPPYEVLDEIIELYVEQDLSADELIDRGLDAELVHKVLGLIRRAEYKRRQAAVGLKVTGKAFGMGRRFPIAHRYYG